MRTFQWLVLASTIALLTTSVIAQQGCKAAPPPQPASAAQVPVGTVREVMHQIIEESSQVLFDSVSVTVSSEGTVEKQPKTDEEWDVIEHSTLQLAEAPNLLKVAGRRVARPNEENTSADPTELTPLQIQAKMEANRDLFNKYVNELQTVAQEALTVVKAKNVQGLFDIGEKIDLACENCHLEFWYPNEKPR